ncbi:unnamed protein product [Allacma fusca]|uniref:C2H2-type domain-containing protein n=1 Tax=Allacma fusca TaxID=39272 RepID=A0A8J2J5N8_9HEXA|nr:unnamed protein product [Allacma fusca]
MPEGQRTGHKTEIPTLCESEAPVTGTIKTFNLGNLVDFKKLGKLAMEINNDKPNGLTDGSHLRRRRRSSGDSDLVVLSVVFNKKKQKQNDEVAIAIERLRENGVNCVLFTMNDFRNGSTKPDSATPDSICLSSSTPSSTNSFCQLGRENKDSTKLFSSLPMIPSIKCEVSENSNGSTDSNSSSNVAIHESVEKVINSFSPSPSPSPPPLSPQLLPTTPANSEQEFTSKSVMSMAASLHELLSPLLPDSQPPTLRHEVSVSANNKVEPTLQEIQICSSSSPGEYHSNPKRRRRRVRKPYTHRKAQLKKKLKIIADEAKAIRAAQRAAQARTETILPISDTVSISSCGNQEEISSSNDRLLPPHPIESSLCTGNGNSGNEESNSLISLTNFTSEDKIVKDDLIRNSNCATVTTVGSINAHEDETIIPDSSSSTIVHSTLPTCITTNKKRKRNGGIGRRKKKRNRLIQPVSNDLLKVGAFENMAKVNSACRNGFTTVNGNISICDPPGSKSVVDRKPQVGAPLLLELVDGHINGDDEDSMPLASLLKRKRAFSPDIIRGIRQNNSQKLSNMDVQKRFNHVDSLEASRPSCIPGSQKDDSVKREIVKITHCVQSEKISQVNQVQPNCASEEPNGFIDVFKDGRKKKKKRGGKLRLVVRKNMRLKKSSRKHFLATPNEQILESSQLGRNITDPNHLIQDIIQGESVITTVNGYQGLEPLREKVVKAEALAKQPIGSSAEVFQIKEEACLGQDDDSVPSIDSGLPSSENASVSDDFKAENGSESSGSSSLDSQLKQPSDSLNSSSVFDPTNGSHDFGYLESAPGSEDSLPASPDGMQLRRSNFYFLISDNVRKNMENYLDGRMVTKVQTKRRKRTKNSYLLNHGDNYPNDPEAPYRLHMATQVLLKLNKRRAKCKPKEDRGRSLLSYLKLVPKRPPRTGKAALPSPKEEEPKEPHEEPLFSGEWTIPRKYICHVCGQIESSFWDMVMHKGELHPGVLVTHTELTGQVPHSLVRTLSTTGTSDEESIPSCSKCSATFSMTQDLHRHIFECAGNAVWLEEEKTPRKRKSKRRRGFKRRLSNTPKKTKKPELPKRRPSEVFKCEFCPREFKTEGWLKNHLVSHSLPVSIPLEKLSLPSRASNNSTSARLFKT